MQSTRKRILFVIESVTFAHITRSFALAASLPSDQYDVHIASSEFPDMVFNKFAGTKWNIRSLTSAEFTRALAKGKITHPVDLLKSYVLEELEIFKKIKPDVVVGDFRLSLSVSTRLSKIPYINLANAYWSPNAVLEKLPPIDYPVFNMLGEKFGAWVFNKSIGFISDMLMKPYNQLRKHYALHTYGNIFDAYTDGDHTLYCDVPELVHLRKTSVNEQFIGPVLWNTDIEEPEWWHRLPDNKPIIFFSPGSSGSLRSIVQILHLLSQLPVNIVFAKAGRKIDITIPFNCLVTDFIAGDLIGQRADIFITNGGSLLAYHALRYGKPVLGITTNYDQQLFMEHVVKAGVGLTQKSGTLDLKLMKEQVMRLLSEHGFRLKAEALAEPVKKHQKDNLFASVLAKTGT